MNQALKPRQVALVAAVLLILALLVGYRYFTAPGNNTAPEATRELQGASVASLKIVLGPLAPPHLKVENPEELLTHPEPGPEQSGGAIGGGGMAPSPLTDEQRKRQEEQTAREKRAAQRKHKLFTDAIAYLRRAGITVTADKDAYVPEESENPVHLTLLIQGNGTVIDGRPSWGKLGYQVELERLAYLSRRATTPTTVQLQTGISPGSVGVVSQELLPRRQEEAIGKALEAFAQAWKQDNPASPH